MSTPRRKPVDESRALTIQVAVDLSVSDLMVLSGFGRNTLERFMSDPIDPLPYFNLGKKRMIPKDAYVSWRARRFPLSTDTSAIVPPRRRRRKFQV